MNAIARPSPRTAILEPCSLPRYALQVDPYRGCEHRCSYCYALNRAETDWSKEVLVDPEIGSQLEGELRGLQPQTIYLGWNSDPYQPLEAACGQTRQVLELLARRGFSVCLLTKSDLIARDAALIARMPASSAGISIAFASEATRRLFEAAAPANERRIAALKALREAGIRTYALICPVMPFLTEVEALVEALRPHAETIWVYALSMESESGRNWQALRAVLERHFPQLVGSYRQIAFSADHPYWLELRGTLARLREAQGLGLQIGL